MERSSTFSSDRRGAAVSLATFAAAMALLARWQSNAAPTRQLQDESWYITRPRIYSDDRRGADIVAIGDSRMGNAFDPAVIERVVREELGVTVRAWNGCLPGAGPIAHLAWVQRALSHPRPPRLVLLSISPYMFSSTVTRAPQREALTTIYRVRDAPALLRAGASAEDALTAVTADLFPPYRVRPRVVELFTQFNGVRESASRGVQGYEDHPSVPADMQRSRAAGRVQGYRPELLRARGARFGNASQGYFVECLRALRARGVTTLVLDSLSASQMDAVMGPDSIYPEHVAWVRAQAAAHGATFVDAHRPPSNDDEDFSDVDHVGGAGAVRFSNWLAHTAIVPALGAVRRDRASSCRTVFDFEDPELPGWQRGGPAAERAVAAAPTRAQTVITGHRGTFFANTFHPIFGDAAAGELTSPAFTLDGDVLRVRVGGGAGPGVGVELLVDGAVVGGARGDDRERLVDRALDVRAWRGRSARIRVVDGALGPWGHTLADDVALCPE